MEEQKKGQKHGEEIKWFSRRTIIKASAGLFAFIPAVKYLLDAPNAFAYTPCADPSQISCSWQTVCADPNCRGYTTIWKYQYCIDLRNGQNCPSYQSPPVDTGTRC